MSRSYGFLLIGLLGLGMLLSVSCQEQPDMAITLGAKDFPNVLDIRNVPSKSDDWSAFSHSDLGSWFSFALPDDSGRAGLGTFPGPFLMTHGQWLSQGLARLTLFDVDKSQQLDFAAATDVRLEYIPGQLSQSFVTEGVAVGLDLCFVSNRVALVRANITNVSGDALTLRSGWAGNVFMDLTSLAETENGVRVVLGKDVVSMQVLVPADMAADAVLADDGRSYLLEGVEPMQLEDGESFDLYVAHTLSFEPGETEDVRTMAENAFASPDEAFADNSARWNGYLDRILITNDRWQGQKEYQTVAVKCLITLINNWKCANGDLLHDGFIPSYAVWYFNGFWAWDSWKVSVAMAQFAPEQAKDGIRAMFDYQNERGMVADCIFVDAQWNNWINTKPPLAAWSVWKVYEADKDRGFVEEMYPALLKYHRWWYTDRDHDGNGLCEYGSPVDTLIGAKWESGMDNAVRFDSGQMVKNNEQAWSINQESVDLNSYLYAEKQYLASMALLLGKTDEATALMAEAVELKALIRETMFDDETGYYYDVRLEDKSFVKVQGPEGWIPLWAALATQAEADRVKLVMTDPGKFATFVPFGTVAVDEPGFSRGYWRGPVWLDQAYFGVRALQNYGFLTEAESFTRQLFDRPQGLKGSMDPIRENYWPLDGEGLVVNHFGWSAGHLLMLYRGI